MYFNILLKYKIRPHTSVDRVADRDPGDDDAKPFLEGLVVVDARESR